MKEEKKIHELYKIEEIRSMIESAYPKPYFDQTYIIDYMDRITSNHEEIERKEREKKRLSRNTSINDLLDI